MAPDTPSQQPCPPGMEARIAVLEEIARTTAAALGDIRSELRENRQELRNIRQGLRDVRSDYRWPLGILLGAVAALLGVMARGFGWP